MKADITDEHIIILTENGKKIDKGSVFKQHGRWWWERVHGGVESFHPHYTLKGVKEHIANVCLVPANLVKLEKKHDVQSSI